ncbi:MAG: hypothetical protein QXW56_06020 [Nitrososphaerota archaeon]
MVYPGLRLCDAHLNDFYRAVEAHVTGFRLGLAVARTAEGRRLRLARRVTSAELRRLKMEVAYAVERRGRVLVTQLLRSWGYAEPVAEQVAMELARKLGWRLIRAPEGVYLALPEQGQARANS